MTVKNFVTFWVTIELLEDIFVVRDRFCEWDINIFLNKWRLILEELLGVCFDKLEVGEIFLVDDGEDDKVELFWGCNLLEYIWVDRF